MRKLIILAGYPATGKTYMANKIMQKYTSSSYLALDNLKEYFYDLLSFNKLEQRILIDNMSKEVYYKLIIQAIKINEVVILDYPFGKQQIGFFNTLQREFNLKIITIRLTGDIDIIYKRKLKRDKENDRHPAHLLETYKKGINYNANIQENITLKEFINKCEKEEYNTFSVGKTIVIDTTDFSLINYEEILKEI